MALEQLDAVTIGSGNANLVKRMGRLAGKPSDDGKDREAARGRTAPDGYRRRSAVQPVRESADFKRKLAARAAAGLLILAVLAAIAAYCLI